MRKTALVITIGIVLFIAGYLFYEKWYGSESTSLWNNVPNNAVLVFESKNVVESWNDLLETSLWNSLKSIESFENIKNDLIILDSIESGSVASLLQQNSLISMHVTKKNDFDFIFYIDFSLEKNQRVATKLLDYFKDNTDVRFSERIYQDYNISELTLDNHTFTYFINKNVFIGSFTSFLVEDVVRLVNDGYKSGFKANNVQLYDMPKLANDDGNIYINMETASLWLSSFMSAEHRKSLKELGVFGQASFFDLDISDTGVLLNGFTSYDTKSDFLSTFNTQIPVRGDLKYYIPNRASAVYRFGISDGGKWNNELVNYWKNNKPGFLSRRSKFEQQYGFTFSKLYSWIENNLALVKLEAFRGTGEEKLVFIQASDAQEALNQFNTFSESLAEANGDSVYVERFSTYEIRELQVSDFPKFTFGPLFGGFEECYFMLLGDYIVIGNSMLTLKSLIEDIENENTWGRSVVFNKFLESNLEESNVSVTFNTRRIWENLINELDPEWKNFALKYANQIKGFDLGSIQFSKLDESFYTSVAIQYEEQLVIKEKQSYEALKSATLNNKVITKPYVVKNHVNGNLEVAVQDSAYNFTLISQDGSVQWSDSLGQPMISDIEQIDYYKNGKLQYFFATRSALHIIDRLGNYIDGYPVAVDANLKFASVVDYDKSKRYRFFLADERGNLFLYNKEGVSLEGWNPRVLTGKLASAPFHIRVRGKDCMVAIQQDGIVNAMNRRGEMMPGFPLQLDARIKTSPFINMGSDLDKTVITILSREGRLIHFNLNGKVLSTEQLYKPTKDTRFQLIPDALGKHYIISRQDMARLVLLAPDNEEILAKDYLSSDHLNVQYYDLSSDHKIYAVTDVTQSFTYIYNKEGQLVNSRPFDSEQEIALIYFDSTKKYHVYTISGDTFKLITF
ncbi:hypothetical protein JMN32_17895 [Fulvivirga sp. 29W222]|uniref:DUF3352 domain-containing protein n=1 Tax=Fulvivirga marina TaxID=2494733 RepID=A0A937G0C9_9BACT|nr:hypothetical protein [Fulvivirga marina]MBL6448197.1 hypothetical protein [Fulvivirga marina]